MYFLVKLIKHSKRLFLLYLYILPFCCGCDLNFITEIFQTLAITNILFQSSRKNAIRWTLIWTQRNLLQYRLESHPKHYHSVKRLVLCIVIDKYIYIPQHTSEYDEFWIYPFNTNICLNYQSSFAFIWIILYSNEYSSDKFINSSQFHLTLRY